MEPITILIGTAALILGSASTAAVLKWDDIKIALQGKKIAILGATGTGKTTMFTYITQKILPEPYKQTLKPQEIKGGIFKFDELQIVLKNATDVSGSKVAWEEWKEFFMEADLVFYIIRSDEFLNRNESTVSRVCDDLEQMVKWDEDRSKNQGSSKKKLIFIVGNHWTTDQRFERAKKDNKLAEYQEEFRELLSPQHVKLKRDGIEVKVEVGCLGNEQDARDLIENILKEICKK